jgi:hypothetical protein
MHGQRADEVRVAMRGDGAQLFVEQVEIVILTAAGDAVSQRGERHHRAAVDASLKDEQADDAHRAVGEPENEAAPGRAERPDCGLARTVPEEAAPAPERDGAFFTAGGEQFPRTSQRANPTSCARTDLPFKAIIPSAPPLAMRSRARRPRPPRAR